MYQLVYVISATVKCIIGLLQLLMLIRAVLSWIPMDEDNRINTFLYAVTEPVITPVRMLIEKFGWFEGMPIDMSFFITFIILSILEMFL